LEPGRRLGVSRPHLAVPEEDLEAGALAHKSVDCTFCFATQIPKKPLSQPPMSDLAAVLRHNLTGRHCTPEEKYRAVYMATLSPFPIEAVAQVFMVKTDTIRLGSHSL
jgi:hypothetical protein